MFEIALRKFVGGANKKHVMTLRLHRPASKRLTAAYEYSSHHDMSLVFKVVEHAVYVLLVASPELLGFKVCKLNVFELASV